MNLFLPGFSGSYTGHLDIFRVPNAENKKGLKSL